MATENAPLTVEEVFAYVEACIDNFVKAFPDTKIEEYEAVLKARAEFTAATEKMEKGLPEIQAKGPSLLPAHEAASEADYQAEAKYRRVKNSGASKEEIDAAYRDHQAKTRANNVLLNRVRALKRKRDDIFEGMKTAVKGLYDANAAAAKAIFNASPAGSDELVAKLANGMDACVYVLNGNA